MLLIYNLGIKLYWLAILIVSPFNQKAKLFINGRKKIWRKISSEAPKNQKVAWFHCASLGEFEQARPVIEKFKTNFPEISIVLTFFSPSGYEIRKNYEHADFICYLPLDDAHNAKKFIEIINPSVALFVKYEFWHHYFHELALNKIPIVSFSSIFRKKQIYFKRFLGGFNRKIIKKINHYFVQNEESVELLASIGIIKNITLTGDTRFDRVNEICNERKKLPIIEKFKNEKLLFIVGSAWQQDIRTVETTIEGNQEQVKTIIAPHEVNKKTIDKLMEQFPQALKYSEANELNVIDKSILIIDNIGMLSSIYGYGEIAYIGGAFGKGLHNILEAATFGLPIIFGPKYQNFNEAKDLIQLGGATSVKNKPQFDNIFTTLVKDDFQRHEKSSICKNYVESNLGATQKIIEFCQTIL